VQDSIVEKFNAQELVVLGLTRNLTSQQWLLDYVKNNDITFTMLYNADAVFETYGAYSDPTYVIVDKAGQIRLRKSTYYSIQIQTLVSLIRSLLNE